MAWWLWSIFGLLLLAAETVVPAGLFLLFFGVAALLVGMLVAVVPLIPSEWQWIVFAVTGPILAVTIRPHVHGRMSRRPAKTDIDRFAGEKATALETIAPEATGQVEFRGTGWQAKNVGALPIAKGDHCTITAIDNLTLSVQK